MKNKRKCHECGHRLGSEAGLEDGCEVCWHAEMDRVDDLRDMAEQRKVDECLGK